MELVVDLAEGGGLAHEGEAGTPNVVTRFYCENVKNLQGLGDPTCVIGSPLIYSVIIFIIIILSVI